jgi:hypothetical protein
MKRVLPDSKPSLDYTLWGRLKTASATQRVIPDQRNWLASIDRGASHESELWAVEGRNRSQIDDTKVFDFISLSNTLDGWFDEVQYNEENLQKRITAIIDKVEGGPFYFDGQHSSLLEINWTVLGRVIGSAVANYGSKEKWWAVKGNDALTTHRFWSELKRLQVGESYDSERDARHNSHYSKGIETDVWQGIGDFYRQRKTSFDPDSEMLRSTSHRPSSPFWRENHRPHRIYPNPLALMHQSLMYAKRRGDEDPGELANDHGKITLQILGEAIKGLRGQDEDRFARFAIKIHGLCAFHIVRTDIMQQKIGLHLFSNLVAKRTTRDVGGTNVPDIAKQLKTGFSLARVLSIMADKNHKIIDWSTAEKETVDEIVNELS